jgi:rhodanese-related sulfurtransferase
VGEFLLNPTNAMLVALFFASGTMLVWPELSKLLGGASAALGTLEATRLMNQPSTLVLDIRDDKDFAAGHLPRARHIPLKELESRAAEIQKFKEKPVLVTCRNGNRSGSAARVLKKLGFTNVFQLKGGLAAWEQASLPVER